MAAVARLRVPQALASLATGNAHTRRPPGGASRGARTLVVLATIALVIVPVARVEWSREIARWHEAAARELDLQGAADAAVARMDQAIAWCDQDALLFLQRAQYKLDTQQWQSGLEDCDRARQLAPNSPLVGELRSQFLQHLGRPQEAMAEWREILQADGKVRPVRVRINSTASHTRQRSATWIWRRVWRPPRSRCDWSGMPWQSLIRRALCVLVVP